MHTLLAARNITVGHPTGKGLHSVLQDANFVIKQGQRIALLGANGAGKSTLLMTLIGALQPQSGQVLFKDNPVRKSEINKLRKHVQLVLQDPDDQLFSADVFQDISFGPTNMNLPENEVREMVYEAMELLGVTHLAQRATHQLSYGERKRVATAGAVAMKPDVLLLDEPTAGLDPRGVDAVEQALERVHSHGTTIVVATHDVDMALAWADEIAVVVDHGVIQSTPEQLLGDSDLIARAGLRLPFVAHVSKRLGHPTIARTVDQLVEHILRH